MGIGACEVYYGKPSKEFQSVEDVNHFIEERSGKKLETERIQSGLVENRGCVFKVKAVNADAAIEAALK